MHAKISYFGINLVDRGRIETADDAVLLVQAVLNGWCAGVQDRLTIRESASITGGQCFVFIESRSGIKRWTDGKKWGPSRRFGAFLEYHETNTKPESASGLTKRTISIKIAQ
jgi:hypothetical protein